MSEPIVSRPEPVAIVGTGPVGMFLALDLAHYGVRSTVLDRGTSARTSPKGNTHNARTMEHYRRLGIAEQVRQLGLPGRVATDVAYFTRLGGYELHRHLMPSRDDVLAQRARAAADSTSQLVEPLHRANQVYVEQLLYSLVQGNPMITLRAGCEVTNVREEAGSVEISVVEVRSGAQSQLRARHLVGCDGVRSTVRAHLEIAYGGHDAFETLSYLGGPMHSAHVRSRAIHERYIKRQGWQYWLLGKTITNFVNLNGDDEFLYHATAADSSPDRIASVIQSWADGPVDVDVIGVQSWTAGRALVADSYGSGRILLCGDAVHLFTPTGGFGMNTGIDDAANLAWKLAAVEQGWGGPGLLGSYESERRPVAFRNTNAARDLASNIRTLQVPASINDDSTDGRAARTALAGVLPGFAEEFASLGIQLGARYDESPVVLGDGAPPPADSAIEYTPSSVPGGRAPHLWLPGGTSLFDCLGPGFTILQLGRGGAETARQLREALAARRIPVHIVVVDLPAAEQLYERHVALVRPDHHIAWRGDSVEDAAAVASIVSGHA